MTAEQRKKLLALASRFKDISREFHTTLMDLNKVRKECDELYLKRFAVDPISLPTQEQFQLFDQLNRLMERNMAEQALENFVSELDEILI